MFKAYRLIAVLIVPLLFNGSLADWAGAQQPSSCRAIAVNRFSENALGAVALDGRWKKMLPNVPNLVHLLHASLLVGSAALLLWPGRMPAQRLNSDSVAALRPYMIEVGKEMNLTGDPIQKRYGRVLMNTAQPVPVEPLQDGGLIAVDIPTDINHNFERDSATGLLKFKVLVEKNFLDTLIGVRGLLAPANQILMDRYIDSFIVKEVGSLSYSQAHPGIGPIENQLYVWLATEMNRRRQGHTEFNLQASDLLDPRIVEPAEHFLGTTMGPEVAGYAAKFAYLPTHGLDATQLEALAVQVASFSRQLADQMRSEVRMLKYAPATHPDQFWRLSMYHLRSLFITNGAWPGSSPIAQTTRLAYAIEAAAGRAAVIGGRINIPRDPQTDLPPATYMPYLRNPEYIRPSAAEMKRIAPPPARASLRVPFSRVVAQAA